MPNKKLLFVIAIQLVLLSSYAQKLPNVQMGGQLLPSNLNIDGKLNEWPDGLKASNTATRLAYTMADNADNLYLAIQTNDISTINKVLVCGMTFTVNPSGKKSSPGSSVTIPLNNAGWTPSSKTGFKGNFTLLEDSTAIIAAIKKIKFIGLNNFTGLEDSVAIYNEHGILTKMRYDHSGLVCELLIPKKFAGLVGTLNRFAYQVKVNGLKQPDILPFSPPPATPPPGRAPSHPSYILAEISAPTDFWGEYTLAK